MLRCRHYLIILSLCLFTGCPAVQKPKVEAVSSQPTPPPSPPPTLPPEVEPVKKTPTNWLAELKEGTHTVDYRLHNESVWKKAEPGITFIRFDALQTQDDSKAKVLYKSGTQLDIKSNTMIIFDNDPGVDKNHEDRVVIKNGELVGTTRNELWVFTDAGLIQLKAEKNKHKAAQARVTLQPHQKLKINVQTGQADVIYTDDKKIEKIQIAANKQIELNRPTIKLDEKKLQELIIAAPKIKTPIKSELIIENPKADTTTDQKTLKLKDVCQPSAHSS